MKRGMFTIEVREEVPGEPDFQDVRSYCANHISAYDGRDGMQAIAFFSSGRLITVLGVNVISVSYSTNWSHCNECDGPVTQMGYLIGEKPKVQA